jgi:hypothetical protein
VSRLLIVEPMRLAAVTASRGTGAANLATRDPKEAWIDAAAGSAATITVDLGAARTIDTIALLYVRPPAAAASWSIDGGVGAADTPVLATTALRVPDVAGEFEAVSHALWTGAARTVRYVTLTVTQPAGSPPVSAGVLVIGRAFVAELGQEWGAGRQPIDTGTATALPSGGFSTVEGVRKSLFSWTFGDLTVAETEQLETIALHLGETAPGLVIEDADATPGLRRRIHYGLFKKWRGYERRNRRQTRWEIGIEQWV